MTNRDEFVFTWYPRHAQVYARAHQNMADEQTSSSTNCYSLGEHAGTLVMYAVAVACVSRSCVLLPFCLAIAHGREMVLPGATGRRALPCLYHAAYSRRILTRPTSSISQCNGRMHCIGTHCLVLQKGRIDAWPFLPVSQLSNPRNRAS